MVFGRENYKGNLDTAKKQKGFKEIEASLKEVAGIARKCLENPDFKEYRKRYEQLAEMAVSQLINLGAADLKKDDFYEKYIRVSVSCSLLGELLNRVDSDIKKAERFE